MRKVKITVPSSSTSEMNSLVDIICEVVAKEDPARLRDKFKMVDVANPKKIMDLCEHLNLNVEFRNSKSKKEIAVSLSVPESFEITESKPKKKEASIKKKEPIEKVVELKPLEEPKGFESVIDENKKVPEDLKSTDTGDDDDDDDIPF